MFSASFVCRYPVTKSMVKRVTDCIHFNYCRSGNIRGVLIFANFAGRTNSRCQKSRENYYYNCGTKEKEKFANNSRIIRNVPVEHE